MLFVHCNVYLFQNYHYFIFYFLHFNRLIFFTGMKYVWLYYDNYFVTKIDKLLILHLNDMCSFMACSFCSMLF